MCSLNRHKWCQLPISDKKCEKAGNSVRRVRPWRRYGNNPGLHRVYYEVTSSQFVPTAAELVDRYCDVRSRTEALAAPLTPEDQTVQSMPDVSPTKWHRAHVTWFFETFVLKPYQTAYEPFHPRYSYLFNSYYEAVGERHPRPDRGLVSRPGAGEVGEYRLATDQRVRALLESADEGLFDILAPLMALGTNHEEQHQELLLMDIKHVLSCNSLQPGYLERSRSTAADPGPAGWVGFEGGIVPIGRPSTEPGFAFDNEGPDHEVLLQPYRLADRLVTAGEWLEFMDDGGYERSELWLSDGWYRRLDEGWVAPLYWRTGDVGRVDDGVWRVHRMDGTSPVDPHEPVCHISFYEADAFATWAGERLPTEFEWEAAVGDRPVEGSFLAPNPLEGALHPASAGPPTGELRQMYGDCWEWTGSPYRPYPGFQPVEGAIGEYNGKFMVNQMVLRGGCAFTPQGHTRRTYRNFFHPDTRWHLSGVRLASDD